MAAPFDFACEEINDVGTIRDMYFEVFLEGFCVRLTAILDLEDDLVHRAGMSGTRAVLAFQS